MYIENISNNTNKQKLTFTFVLEEHEDCFLDIST